MPTKDSFRQNENPRKGSFYEQMQIFSSHLRQSRMASFGLSTLKSPFTKSKAPSNSQHQYSSHEKNKFIQLNKKLETLVLEKERKKKGEWEKLIYNELREQKENIRNIQQRLRQSFERPREISNHEPIQKNFKPLPYLDKSRPTIKQQIKQKVILSSVVKPIIKQVVSEQHIKPPTQLQSIKISKKFKPFTWNPHSKASKKFRIAVYCVIFMNYLPKYVKKFTIQRFNHFKANQQIYRKQLSQTIINIVLNLKMYQSLIPVKIVEQYIDELQDDQQQQSQQESINQNQIFSLDLPLLQQAAIQLLRQLIKTLLQPSSNLHRLSLFHFNCSFCPDECYLMQQVYRLNVHPTRNYLMVAPSMTKALIMFEVLVKTVVCKVLMNPQHNPLIDKRINKLVADKQDKELYVNFFWRRLYVVGFFIYQYCMEIAEEAFRHNQGNIDTIDNDRVVMPIKPIHLHLDKKQEKKQQYIKKTQQKYVIKETDYKIHTLKEFDYIENIYDFKGDISNAINYLTENVKLSKEINVFAKKLYFSLFSSRRKLYDEIKAKIFINSAKQIKEANFGFNRQNQGNAEVVKEIIKKLKSND